MYVLTDTSYSTASGGADTNDGRLIVCKGDVLSDDKGFNYTVLEKYGSGTFGDVYCVIDDKYKQIYACKVFRSNIGKEPGTYEVNIMLKLKSELTEEERWNMVRMDGCFEYEGHIVILYEELGPDFYQLLKKRNFAAMGLNMIRPIFRDVAKACCSLHKLGLVHADIKPENISHVRNTTISKLIDFGGCIFQDTNASGYFTSRYYRAPEIILGYPVTTAADIWSLACTIAEFALSLPLFFCEHEHQLLRVMARIVGPFPQKMLKNAPFKDKFFEGDRLMDESKWCKINRRNPATTVHWGPRITKLDDLIVEGSKDYELMWDLLKKMFKYNPEERITAEEILKHPFLADVS